MRIRRTLVAIIISSGICVCISAEKSSFIDFEGFHRRGITEVPLHRLSHDDDGSETLTIGDQVNLLKEFLEEKTGKKLISDGNPMIVTDLSQLNFHSSKFILARLQARDGIAASNGSIWLVKNSSHWQQALKTESSAPENARWYIQPLELPSDDQFCNGMFMVMAMGGFQWSLGKHDAKPDCLNYFVPAWKLDDNGKFTGAMVYSFLLGMMTEAITNFQIWLRPFLGTGRLRRFTMPVLYALQQWLGYIAMMVTMMYSVELFGSLLLGLVLGRLLFLPRSVTKPIVRVDEGATSPRSNEIGVTLSTIPESEEALLVGQTALRRRRT